MRAEGHRQPLPRIASTSSCGRGMTWTDTTSPILPAAAAPASVAAFTAPTSPRTITVTRPPPICSRPISTTFAALTIASAASMAPTRPRVSTRPRAVVGTELLTAIVAPVLGPALLCGLAERHRPGHNHRVHDRHHGGVGGD